jgi:phosphoribosylformylglycinamidine synthase
MPQTTLHLSCFEGADALSGARARALLERLQALEPSLQALQARHVHWVATPEAPDAGLRQRLAALLDSTPAAGAAGAGAGDLIVVMPRLGTVSPWASKAGDIARNCALPVRRRARPTWQTGLPPAPRTHTGQTRAARAAVRERTA